MGNDGEVILNLDKPRTAVLDLNAIRDFERATNKNFWAIEGTITGSDTLALLWACLRQEDENLTQHDIGKMVKGSKWIEVNDKMAELLGQLTGPNRKDRRAQAKTVGKTDDSAEDDSVSLPLA